MALNVNPMIILILFTVFLLLMAFASHALGGEAENLVVNGGFQQDSNGDDWPDGWRKSNQGHIVRQDDNVWLMLEGSQASTDQTVQLQPDWWKLELTMRMRATNVIQGEEGWQNARLAMSFYNKDGERVGPWPDVFYAVGTTDWLDCRRIYDIPPGADHLILNPANFGAEGNVEFDDIRIMVSQKHAMHKFDAPIPEGAEDVWNSQMAWRQSSSTRETICINGLWAFRPLLEEDGQELPAQGDCWGWFKVPGIWPRDNKSAQQVVWAPWLEEHMEGQAFDQAWYQRDITIPEYWRGRRILLDFTMVQTHAQVLLDGQKCGEVWFPGGTLDVTQWAEAGQTHSLSILLTARPLEEESTVFMAPDRIIKSEASVQLKGLTGDVFLVSEPQDVAIADVHVICSTRQDTITFDVGLRQPTETPVHRASVRIMQGNREVKVIPATELKVQDNRLSISTSWANPKLWDTDTPENIYDAVVTLYDEEGGVLDESLPIRFGFREFWIDGRDFYLNGGRIHLRALHTRNINDYADRASLGGARNTCQRMREYGFNFLITANYNFSFGTVGYLDGLYNAADETGILASFSLPHCKDFNWKLNEPEQQERYRRLTEWLIRRVQNHPSIVVYAMNHNATGYYGDQNPLKIDGKYDPDQIDTKGTWSSRNRAQARIAAEIARNIDPTRPVYHHQSGNLDDMHTVNIYLNWAPLQERSDWLEHWSVEGVKPLFFVEWGLPHISSWSSYRGPKFIWSSEAFQSIWDSEFAAAYNDQKAYYMTESKIKALELEERLWASDKPFHWGYMSQAIYGVEENHLEITTLFANDNWRSHRTWGISAMLPWDQGEFWRRINYTPSMESPDLYRNLQQPGIVPDIINPGDQYIYDRMTDNWKPSSTGRSFLRWNMPLAAYIGGGPDHFTGKSHNFLPGDTVHKQLVILNDTRRSRKCYYEWRFTPDETIQGEGQATIKAGDKALVPVAVKLPQDAEPGRYSLSAVFTFDTGEVQRDGFDLDVLPSPDKLQNVPEESSSQNKTVIGLYDPKGDTASLLDCLEVSYRTIQPDDSLANLDLLIIGREALSNGSPCPDLSCFRNGLNVLVFEQTAETLEQRLGFRINIHGLRYTYARVPSHPALNGLTDGHLHDWRGSATLTSPYLDVPQLEQSDPKWRWCGFENTRVWRCGNRGNVASVLIEKPPKGHWLPIVDGGFDLQYSPLVEFRQGAFKIIFCQMDGTGRTQPDPAAMQLCRNLLSYLTSPIQAKSREVFYAGDERGRETMRQLAIQFHEYKGKALGGEDLLVIGPDARDIGKLGDFLRNGLNVLCLGLRGEELNRHLPIEVASEERQSISTTIERFDEPELKGISNAEIHWRTKPDIAALKEKSATSNEVLRVIPVGSGRVVLCQTAPWMFNAEEEPYVQTTYRRTIFLVSRLLANLGATAQVSMLERLAAPLSLFQWDLPQAWVGRVDREDRGQDAGWWQMDFDDSDWKPIAVPGAFDEQRPELADYNGLFWYRLNFRLPKNLRPEGLTLHLGPIDDESWVWLNGKFLGQVTRETHPEDYWQFPREFNIDPDMLRMDVENVLAVRVNDTYLTGGIHGTPKLLRPSPWLESYYIQAPEASDDPYRYYRW